ncbi:MAG: nitroreductase family protein [Candidatus Methanoperedens sp.]|nr:nitroreductase family protein [Candidatus Methanoperedens sp.]
MHIKFLRYTKRLKSGMGLFYKGNCMEVLDAIRNRRSVREFKPDIVPDEVLRKILEAARWAPSPFNTQPWEFIIIKDKSTLKAISKIARYSSYLEFAPMAVAVVVPPINSKFSWIESIGEPGFAAAMAVQNLILAAWDAGVGTCWVSIERDKVRDILKLPDTHFVLTVIPIGYPVTEPAKHDENSRKKLSDIISYETSGERTGSI